MEKTHAKENSEGLEHNKKSDNVKRDKAKKQRWVLYTIFLLLLLTAIYLFYNTYIFNGVQTLEVTKEMKGTSVNKSAYNNTRLGISADRDMLFFGRIPETSNITKILEVHNPSKYVAYSEVIVKGNISRYIIVESLNSKGIVVIDPNSTKEINIKFTAKEPGNYSGTITLLIKVPKNKILEKYYEWVYE